MKGRLIKLAVVGAISAGGLTILPAHSALANTYCSDGVNAGIAGGGSTWWGWCNTEGGTVRFRFTLACPDGGGGTTPWKIWSGGTAYTDSETCWWGLSPYGYHIDNG